MNTILLDSMEGATAVNVIRPANMEGAAMNGIIIASGKALP